MTKNIIVKQKGASLVEIIVVVFVIGLVGIAILSFLKNIFSFNNIISQNMSAQEQIRKVFKMATAEIRSASPSSNGSYPIEEAKPFSFIFYCDIDNDGLKERVRFFSENNVFKKGVIKPNGEPLTYNPENEKINELVSQVINGSTPIFDYYDANYDGFSPPLSEPVDILKIRLVKINLIINGGASKSPLPLNFTTQVSMRNLKDNL